MQLKEYLKSQNITQFKFAVMSNICPQTVNDLCGNRRYPKDPLIKKIEELTNGAVTKEDFEPIKHELSCPTCGKRMQFKNKN